MALGWNHIAVAGLLGIGVLAGCSAPQNTVQQFESEASYQNATVEIVGAGLVVLSLDGVDSFEISHHNFSLLESLPSGEGAVMAWVQHGNEPLRSRLDDPLMAKGGPVEWIFGRHEYENTTISVRIGLDQDPFLTDIKPDRWIVFAATATGYSIKFNAGNESMQLEARPGPIWFDAFMAGPSSNLVGAGQSWSWSDEIDTQGPVVALAAIVLDSEALFANHMSFNWAGGLNQTQNLAGSQSIRNCYGCVSSGLWLQQSSMILMPLGRQECPCNAEMQIDMDRQIGHDPTWRTILFVVPADMKETSGGT